jgi:hypothetical protein
MAVFAEVRAGDSVGTVARRSVHFPTAEFTNQDMRAFTGSTGGRRQTKGREERSQTSKGDEVDQFLLGKPPYIIDRGNRSTGASLNAEPLRNRLFQSS